MKEFHHSRHCLSFQEWFPNRKSSRTLESTHTHTHSHTQIVTCHLFNYCSNFKNKIDHMLTHTLPLSTHSKQHTSIPDCSCAHWHQPQWSFLLPKRRCTGIMSLLLKLIRGHFPRYSLTLWNKSTKALMFANPESSEVSWIFYQQ